jgi:NAD(P)-dependent dehydrogenase (short-subunit alcohol dehydrogenase family)
MDMDMDRVTLVTGGGSGAGLGIATALAEEGGVVYVSDFNAELSAAAAEEVTRRGATGISIPADFSDEEQVESLFTQIGQDHGGVELLVNTVAWIDPPGAIVDLPTERWHKTLRTNLDSVMFTTRAAMRTMIPARKGVIINTSSLNGTRGFPDRPGYGATKAAVINFTQTTAMEGRQYGIRANCLVPGGIQSNRLAVLRDAMVQRMEETGGSLGTSVVPPGQPAPELLDGEWIGRYVRFLASDDGRFINGQALVIGEAGRSTLQALFPDI